MLKWLFENKFYFNIIVNHKFKSSISDELFIHNILRANSLSFSLKCNEAANGGWPPLSRPTLTSHFLPLANFTLLLLQRDISCVTCMTTCMAVFSVCTFCRHYSFSHNALQMRKANTCYWPKESRASTQIMPLYETPA